MTEAYGLGTRAVELVGGGEPTAHPEIVQITEDIFAIGDGDMEVGIVTNGVLAERIASVASRMRFIRVSLDTADPELYRILHKAPPRHFDKVIANLRRLRDSVPVAAASRQLGIGYLVVPPYNHGADQIMNGAKLAHDLGLDYIAYRPVELAAAQPQEHWREAQREIARAKRYLRQLKSHTAAFGGVGNRWDTLKPGGHPTGICDSLPLVAVFQANGDIAHCILYRNERHMRVGNIQDGAFTEQWFSDHHQNAWRTRSIAGCPNPCKFYRYNEVVRAEAAGVAAKAPRVQEVAHHLFV